MKRRFIAVIFLLFVYLLYNTYLIVLSQFSDEKIAYVSVQKYQSDIYLFDLNDNSSTRLTPDTARGYSSSWSFDGCLIAYVSNLDVFVLDTRDKLLINLTASLNEDLSIYSYPTWSPDGHSIAYTKSSVEGFGLYSLDMDTMIESLLVEHNYKVGSPDWSSDGSLIVFSGENEHGYRAIFSIQSKGENLHSITKDDVNYSDPSLSPDAKQIAYSANIDDNWDIYVMDIDGSNVRQITFDKGIDSEPDWSSDGERIAFSSDRNGSWEIYSINIDGSDLKQLTDAKYEINQNPRWQPNRCEN